ncbi:hypothetical protein QOZ95_000504 [Paenibacillus brasilensis]|uniref:Uncharacterized protein n=1 Tax=Paenibacillus brasilensis TaxID=128574 RepID=A0ABU0KWM4_9BACL|nr:hypothetical protein [Paenibacillus brasilensis]
MSNVGYIGSATREFFHSDNLRLSYLDFGE